jgi:hypothetical protein
MKKDVTVSKDNVTKPEPQNKKVSFYFAPRSERYEMG